MTRKALLCLLCAVPSLVCLANGPGKGSIRVNPGGGVQELEVRYNISQLMGEPTVNANYRWVAQSGFSASLPSDTVVWIKVGQGTRWAYIKADPTVPTAGKGWSFNATGSPNWDKVLVTEFQGKSALRYMDAAEAKRFWKAGFTVLGVQLSHAPKRAESVPSKPGGGTASGVPLASTAAVRAREDEARARQQKEQARAREERLRMEREAQMRRDQGRAKREQEEARMRREREEVRIREERARREREEARVREEKARREREEARNREERARRERAEARAREERARKEREERERREREEAKYKRRTL